MNSKQLSIVLGVVVVVVLAVVSYMALSNNSQNDTLGQQNITSHSPQEIIDYGKYTLNDYGMTLPGNYIAFPQSDNGEVKTAIVTQNGILNFLLPGPNTYSDPIAAAEDNRIPYFLITKDTGEKTKDLREYLKAKSMNIVELQSIGKSVQEVEKFKYIVSTNTAIPEQRHGYIWLGSGGDIYMVDVFNDEWENPQEDLDKLLSSYYEGGDVND